MIQMRLMQAPVGDNHFANEHYAIAGDMAENFAYVHGSDLTMSAMAFSKLSLSWVSRGICICTSLLNCITPTCTIQCFVLGCVCPQTSLVS